MKILIVSNGYGRHARGGAELAATSLASMLDQKGHEITVLTSAGPADSEGWELPSSGRSIRIYRSRLPYPYHYTPTCDRSVLSKARWHFQDHFQTAIVKHLGLVLESFQPDVVNTHNVQGLGYSVLGEIGKLGLPVVQVLHDLSLSCMNAFMFRQKQECERLCFPCRASHFIKSKYLADISRLSFWSPSQALLNRMKPLLPEHAIAARVIPLPLTFAPPKNRSVPPASLNLLYVGRIEPAKGVGFILEILAELSCRFSFHMTLVGAGSDLSALQNRYGMHKWLTITGHVSAEDVGTYMANADVLMVPSLWTENSPLVIYQAISLGLPILASDVGGLAELVGKNMNGDLLPRGDRAAWFERLIQMSEDPGLVSRWKRNANRYRNRFDPNELTDKVLDLFEETIQSQMPLRLVEEAG
jgi:glycosyltransferase involved in cell wall biosynthesis